MSDIKLRLRYNGAGPVHWNGGSDAFGLQDKAERLHQGKPDPDGGVSFDFLLEVKPGAAEAPVFTGDFAHGPPKGRFLYLGWRNRTGEFAQRLKLPLTSIIWDDVRHAQSTDAPLVCVLLDHNPKATSTGANIGGTRRVTWTASVSPPS